jgi:hypothetical protein
MRIVAARSGCRAVACGLALAAAAAACGSDGPPVITIQTFPGDAPYGTLPENTEVLAFQDGDGPWTALTGVDGTYSATVTGSRYAVATVCRVTVTTEGTSLSLSRVALYYLGVSDTTHLRALGCVDTRPTVQVSAQLQGVPSDQQGEVLFGGSAAQQTEDGTFEAILTRGEPVDVLISALDDSNVPRKVYRGPALVPDANQTLQYDLGVLGTPLDSQPLTVTGLDPTDRVEVRSLLSTRPTQPAWFVDDRPFSSAPPDHFSSVPIAAGRLPGDLTVVSLSVVPTQPSTDGRTYLRSALVAMAAPAPTTVALPGPWSIATPTLENTAPRRATLTLPADPDATSYFAEFTPLGGNDGLTWNLWISAGWLAGRGDVTLVTPDLSALVEGPPTLVLPLDRSVWWTIARGESNVDYGVSAADGMRELGNQIIGTIDPPAPAP